MESQAIKKVVVYSSGNRLVVGDLVRSVAAAGDLPVSVYRSQESLQRGLRQSLTAEVILVFHASSSSDLSFLRSFRNLVKETKLILILHDKQARTVSEGLLASPRFMMFLSSDFSDVTAVLKRILANHEQQSDCGAAYSDRRRGYL